MDYPWTVDVDGALISTQTSLDTLSLERWSAIPYRLSTDTTIGWIHYILHISFALMYVLLQIPLNSAVLESGQTTKWIYYTMRIRGLYVVPMGNTSTNLSYPFCVIWSLVHLCPGYVAPSTSGLDLVCHRTQVLTVRSLDIAAKPKFC